jgi:hypothetical protein
VQVTFGECKADAKSDIAKMENELEKGVPIIVNQSINNLLLRVCSAREFGSTFLEGMERRTSNK